MKAKRSKRIKDYITIAVFLVLLYVPNLVIPMFGRFMNLDFATKQVTSDSPVLTLKNIEKYPATFDKVFDNNLPFRDLVGEAWARINYFALHDSANSGVLIGKIDDKDEKRWLFYSNDDDHNPVENTQGIVKYDQVLFEESVKVMEVNKKELNKRNIKSLYVIVPNKETIYKEKLPDSVKIYSDKTRTDDFIEYLKSNKVANFVYLKNELLRAKENGQVYWRQDTHWNEYGAGMAFKRIIKELKLDYEPKFDYSFTNEQVDRDLATMLKITDYFEDDVPVLDYKNTSRDYKLEKISKNNTIIVSKNETAPVKKSILIVGDSFRDVMGEICFRTFRKCILMHRSDYDESVLKKYNAEIVIFEFVERYMPSIKDFYIINKQ